MKNTRDIVVVVIAVLVIALSAFAAYRLLAPKKNTDTQQAEENNSNTKYVSLTIDENTLLEIQKLSNFPKPALDNIGKTDLFAK